MGSSQYTQEWWHKRRGRVTSSRCREVITGSLESMRKLAAKLKAEHFIDEVPASFNSYTGKATQWGHDHEDQAVAEYAFEYAAEVTRPDFIQHPDYPLAGTSPDLNAVENGVLFTGEVKCPFKEHKAWERINNPLNARVNPYEFYQVQWHLFCQPEAEAARYMVFTPYLKVIEHRLHVRRVDRDKKVQKKMEERMDMFSEIYEGAAKESGVMELF